MAYVQQCGIAAPDDELIERLQALSRGVPLALEGWFNLHQQNVELPPPDPAAPTTRRAIVRHVTDRFLRYCNEDDKHLPPAQQRTREATRNNILTLMLLRRTDVDALAAAWQCGREEADERLNDLADTFSFVFAQEIEREPHALVKEFLREYLREQTSLPVPIQIVVERLVAHFEGRMREREQELVPGTASTQPLSATEREALAAERAAHQRAFQQLQVQIAAHTETSAPVGLLIQRDDADRAIKRIDAQLAPPATEGSPPTRRPLWSDDAWRESLLDLVNVLCWADRSGEKAMRLLVPMFIEALAFHQHTAAALFTTAEEFAGHWQADRHQLFEVLAAGRFETSNWGATDDEMRAILDRLQPTADNWRLTPLHRAILSIQRGQLLLRLNSGIKSENLAAALATADEAARLLPADGGEVAETLAKLYKDVGSTYLWPKRNKAVASSEAVRVLTIATHLAPSNDYAWYDLGVSLQMVKRYDEAVTALWRHNTLDARSPHAYNLLGNGYYYLKRYEEAIVAYQQSIALDPTYATPHSGLGTVYHALQRYEEAIVAYQQSIALDPTYAYLHNGLGNVYRDLKRYEEAIVAHQQSIVLDPTDGDLHNGIGLVYEEQKQYDQAIAAYQQSITLDPTNAYAHRNLGDVYRAQHKYNEAIAAYQQSTTLDPTNAYAHNNLGLVYEEQKQYDQAIAAYQQAIALDPTNAYAHRNLGDVYHAQHKYNEAIAAYQQAITLDSTFASPHYGLGNLYRDLNRNDEAQTAYQRTLDLDPTNYRSMYCLARLERLTGNQEQASAWIDQARPLLPADGFYDRACLESIAGDADAAVEALRVALERGEAFVAWAREDPDFVFIRDDPRYRALVGLDEG